MDETFPNPSDTDANTNIKCIKLNRTYSQTIADNADALREYIQRMMSKSERYMEVPNLSLMDNVKVSVLYRMRT